MYQKHFQDKIRENRAADKEVETQQHFRGNLPRRSLLGETRSMFQFVWAFYSLEV